MPLLLLLFIETKKRVYTQVKWCLLPQSFVFVSKEGKASLRNKQLVIAVSSNQIAKHKQHQTSRWRVIDVSTHQTNNLRSFSLQYAAHPQSDSSEKRPKTSGKCYAPWAVCDDRLFQGAHHIVRLVGDCTPPEGERRLLGSRVLQRVESLCKCATQSVYHSRRVVAPHEGNQTEEKVSVGEKCELHKWNNICHKLVNSVFLLFFVEAHSYLDMRRQREEFRKKLVSIIVSKTDIDADLNSEFPTAEERELMRYYYYIKHGIDTIHVSPMDPKVLRRY